MKIIQKLRSTRGESLIEMLVSIVILGLSIALMLTMVMTSTKITKSTREADDVLTKELDIAEAQATPYEPGVEHKVKIKVSETDFIEVDVNIYKNADDNSLISYSTD